MNSTLILEVRDFRVSPDVQNSWAAPPQFFEVTGPGALVRLIRFAKHRRYDDEVVSRSRDAGECWFDHDLLRRVGDEARFEVPRQLAQSSHRLGAPVHEYIAMYMKFVLRDKLAIAQDWNDLDAFISINLSAGDKLVVQAGPAKRQAAYGENHPLHLEVKRSNIWLEGQATQYVIDFSYAPNSPYAQRIQGPFPLWQS